MNVNGLSNAGFMGGLMQGAQFVEGMQNRTKANERAEAQAGRAQESHDQTTKLNGLKIDEAETKKLQSDFGLMTRKIRLTGEMPSKEEFKKFKPFGVDKLLNSNYIEENQDAGAAIHKARTTGEWGGDAIKALNTTFFDKLREKDKNTGEKHRVVDAQDMGDGRFGLMLEITGKDGKKRIAPLTKNGTPDKDDNLVLFDESKMDEIHQVQMHRANMAYLWEKNKNDPKAAADFLDGIVFPAKAKKAPGLESIYDKSTGGDQKVVWNGSQYVPIGGVKMNDGKGGRSGSGGSGSGGGLSDEDFGKQAIKYQTDLGAILKQDGGGTPEQIAALDDLHHKTTGIRFSLYEDLQQRKLSRKDTSPITKEEMLVATDAYTRGGLSKAVNDEIGIDPKIYGSSSAPERDQYGRKTITTPEQQQAENNNFAQAAGVDPLSTAGTQANGAVSSPPPASQQGVINQAPPPANQQGRQDQPQQDPIQRLSEVSNTLRTYSPINGNIPREKANQLLAERSQLEVQAEALRQEFIKPIQNEIDNLISQQQKQIPGGLADVTDFKTAMRASQAIKNHSTPESKKIQRLKQAVYAINNAESQAEIQKIFADVTVSNIDKNQDNSATL